MKENLRNIIDMMNQDEECDEQNSEKKENNIKERELRLFWEGRARHSSIWSTFLNTSNLLAQILPMIKPKSSEQLLAAKFYMTGSVIMYIFLLMYYSKKLNTPYYVQLYLIFRNSIRLFDFENTRPFID